MRRRSLFLALPVLPLALAACTSTPVDVGYAPSSAAAAPPAASSSRALVAVGPFTDRRGEEDPRWLGSIRGGFGNPIKTLTTPDPVAEVVREAFADGLAARGLLAGDDAAAAPYTLTGAVEQFDATQMARREATAKVLLTLTDTRTGRTLLAQPFEHREVSGSILNLATGVFGSVDELRNVATRTLNQVVDQALDSPAFRDAVR